MQIPEWFERALSAQFDNRLRIRWSREKHQFLIEQKVGRRKLPRKQISPFDDAAIQWTDGYEFVLGVTPGDRAQCPHCGKDSHVPVMRMKFAKCEHCVKDFRACYWPLGDGLLGWLRYTDPYRGGLDRLLADVESADKDREQNHGKQYRNYREDVIRDSFNKIFEIQSVGYTGREKAWIR